MHIPTDRTISFRSCKTLLCAVLLAATPAAAQNAIRIDPAPNSDTRIGRLTAPYRARSVPPVNLKNSSRIESLVRSGNLYLSAQDVVALAIENNIDIEVQRYGPLLAQEVLRRAKAGGALRSVGVGVAPGPQSVSLQGVNVGSAGISSSTAGNGVSSGGGIVTQLGPAIPSFDPTFLLVGNFAHQTVPQSNTILTGTTALIDSVRSYQAQYSQNWDFGFNAQVTYASNHIALNSKQFNINPYTTADLDLQLTQNLLQGFGSAVNGRNIRVQKNNLKVTDMQFTQQVITTVSAVLNLYWDLVSFVEDVRAREQAVKTAQQLYDDNKQQVQFGSLAEIEVTRAEAQLYAAKQDFVIAQTNLLQQETILKNALSRSGVASSGLAEVHVVPLDKLQVPDKDDMKPLDQLMDEALKQRTEIAQSRVNIDSNKLNLVGIKNSLKPSLQAFAELTNNGLTGDITAQGLTQPGVGYLAGGYGNVLAQIFRRNYPSYSAGFSLSIPIRNRAAQSDYATSMIELRQNELSLQKNINQVEVDVRNAVIGLLQARARYESAVKSRVLQDETLKADQQKLALGASTPYQVVQDQRDLANAESSEVQSMANYTHARISFDQALGRTLEVNHVSIEDAKAGMGAKSK
jgi:outer membrane protein TolC